MEYRDIETCLELATSIPDFTNVDKDYIVDWLQRDDDDEGFERPSDSDIAVRIALSTSQQTFLEDEESDNNDNFETREKNSNKSNFCEQENFAFHDAMNLRTIRIEVRKIISNTKKQKLITSYFNPNLFFSRWYYKL